MATPDLKDQRTRDQSNPQPGAPPPPPPPPRERARILLADDEPRIRLALRACLEQAGYEVLEAADGLEAMDVVIHTAPDLMILDLAMPNLDGIRAMSQLSGVHGQLKPRIVVLTAFASGPAMLRTLGLGAAAFLEKPVTPETLRLTVSDALRHRDTDAGGIPIDWTAVLHEEEDADRPH
jgi:CheY-like chemotaxis protein